MQLTKRTKEISDIQSKINKYRDDLEHIYNNTDIEDIYKQQISKALREIDENYSVFKKLSSKGKVSKSLRIGIEITKKLINIAIIIEQLGEEKLSKQIINGCSFLTIEIAICMVELIKRISNLNIIENQIKEIILIEKQINLLKLDNVERIKNAIKEEGFVNLDRYISTIIYLNQKLSKVKKAISCRKKGFAVDNRLQKNILKTELITNSISNLLQNALDFNNLNSPLDQDAIVTIQDVTWSEYQNILETIGDVSWCRISYSDKNLKLMCPSRKHEAISSFLSSVVEQYCFEMDLDCEPFGSTTLKTIVEEKKIGKEPDAAYAFALEKEIPDLAIEVNFSSGSISDLEKYKILKIPEVWMWNKEDKLNIYILENGDYSQVDSSKFLRLFSKEKIVGFIQTMEEKGLNKGKKQIIDFLQKINTPESSS